MPRSRPLPGRLVMPTLAAAVTGAVLGPALRPGYLLVYDMVGTPRQPWTPATWGWGDGLPRAVPQDAVLALVTSVVPGAAVQKAALAAAVFLAVLGAARLVPSPRRSVQAVAGLGYGWNAYLAERLFLGHWGLLLGYAALPWLVRAAARARRGGPVAPVAGWAALAALTPTGGLLAFATAAVVLGWPGRRPHSAAPVPEPDSTPGATVPGTTAAGAAGWSPDRPPGRGRWAAVAAVAVLNGPWVVAGVLARGASTSDPSGVEAFAARAENWSGPVGALLGLGGVWNSEVTPVSRESAMAPLLTLVVMLAGAYGARPLWRRCSVTAPVAVLAGTGLLVAAAGTGAPGRAVVRFLVEQVPGAGLLRDGQKFLAPFALLLAVAAALGVERLAARLTAGPARVALAGAVLLPVVALPDLAWGGLGRLQPVDYPPDWPRVAALLDGRDGDLVVLPFGAFRAFSWNARRTCLDPAAKYLPVPVVAADDLPVGDHVVAGESVRADHVRTALASGEPVAVTGVRWVLVERDTPGEVPPTALAGLRPVYQGPHLALYENPAGRPTPPVASPRRAAIILAHALAAAVAVVAWCGAARSALRRSARRSCVDLTGRRRGTRPPGAAGGADSLRIVAGEPGTLGREPEW